MGAGNRGRFAKGGGTRKGNVLRLCAWTVTVWKKCLNPDGFWLIRRMKFVYESSLRDGCSEAEALPGRDSGSAKLPTGAWLLHARFLNDAE